MLSVCENMQEGPVEAFPSVSVHSRPVGGHETQLQVIVSMEGSSGRCLGG